LAACRRFQWMSQSWCRVFSMSVRHALKIAAGHWAWMSTTLDAEDDRLLTMWSRKAQAAVELMFPSSFSSLQGYQDRQRSCEKRIRES